MSVRFAHTMPFGAECRTNGEVRFRLWAPAVKSVSVVLPRRHQRLPMSPVGNGWFETVTADAASGDQYRFELPDGQTVPDPGSRRQAADVHDASVVVDPRAYSWHQPGWRGRPWHEAVVYELHVGTASAGGTFESLRPQLPQLAALGVTAVELMPVADFPGRWNWGYDGVLPYAPDVRYGTPEQLKALIDDAHQLGLMVLLDVVYNHFGPDGNYLSLYAPQFFTERRRTPWGAAIDFSQATVRDYFVHNALYWIQEYRFDGLRLDAVHEIVDDSHPHILVELARAVRATIEPDRYVHLVLENDNNGARLLERDEHLEPRCFTAQWNDDFHHPAHILATGDRAGYYADFDKPLDALARALAEGFVYQGEFSEYRQRLRGEPSAALPPTAFVNFLQNHDQIGNRAFGERIAELAAPDALRALLAVLLLAPPVPMLFMGEEIGSRQPFCFFSDFQGELGAAVREGRRREFAHFPHFSDPKSRERIPDPQAESTYRSSVVPRDSLDKDAAGWLELYRKLLTLRHREIVPRLAELRSPHGTYSATPSGTITVQWHLSDGSLLTLLAHLSPAAGGTQQPRPMGRQLWPDMGRFNGTLPPWFVAWFLDDAKPTP